EAQGDVLGERQGVEPRSRGEAEGGGHAAVAEAGAGLEEGAEVEIFGEAGQGVEAQRAGQHTLLGGIDVGIVEDLPGRDLEIEPHQLEGSHDLALSELAAVPAQTQPPTCPARREVDRIALGAPVRYLEPPLE